MKSNILTKTVTVIFLSFFISSISFIPMSKKTICEQSKPDISFSNFIGGKNYDCVNAVKTDSSGCTYVAGYTQSSKEDGFPIGGDIPGYSTNHKGSGRKKSDDGFIMKLSSDGTKILYSTYIGGNNRDAIFSIAVDSEGCAYLAGWTESSEEEGFPIEPDVPGYDKTFNKFLDIFVIKLSPDGTKILYSTYLGGEFRDVALSIALDSSNCAYITGWTDSCQNDGFPIEPDVPGFDKTFNGERDAYIIKLSQDGSKLLYSTYIGGSKDEDSESIAVDSDGSAYISGWTKSSPSEGFPVHAEGSDINIDSYDNTLSGEIDAFALKLSPNGDKLIYNTYIGGTKNESSNSIVVDSENYLYVSGNTESSQVMDFPIEPNKPGYDKVFDGESDGFVIKLSQDGRSINASTYIGGSHYSDVISFIDIDRVGNVYVTGWTDSNENHGFPIENDLPGVQKEFQGHYDSYLLKLAPNFTKVMYSTYIGSKGPDYSYALSLDDSNNVTLGGKIESNNASEFPIGGNIPGFNKIFHAGYSDGFVLKLNLPPNKISASITLQIGNKTAYVQLTGSQEIKSFQLEVPPFIIESQAMVPLRFLIQSINGTINWNHEEKLISILKDDTKIKLWPYKESNRNYDAIVIKNQKQNFIQLEIPPQMFKGRTYIPISFFVDSFGARTLWDPVTQTIIIDASVN